MSGRVASLAHAPAVRIACALVLLALAGCAGHPGHGASPDPCRTPRKAVVPDTDGMLTEDDDGARVCMARGQVISVFLNAHTMESKDFWQPVTARPDSAVKRKSNGVMTLPIGVTAALFSLTAKGDVQLASQRNSGKTWRATVVVH